MCYISHNQPGCVLVEPEKSDDEDVEKPPARDVAAMSSQQIDTLLQVDTHFVIQL